MRTRRLPFPLLADLKTAQGRDLRKDLVAGLTTAVLLVPQGMAYALLIGLPPVAGLYAALVAPLGYALLGSSRELSVGPVALDSLLVLSALSSFASVSPDAYAALAATLALLVAAFQVLLGALRLGALVTLLSQPVLSGFTSAAALLIATSQLPHLLGLRSIQGTNFIEMVSQLAPELGRAEAATMLIGAVSIGLLVLQKRFAPRAPGALFVLFATTLLAKVPNFRGGLSLVGAMPEELPRFTLPPLDAALLSQLLPSAFLIAMVGFVESIAVARLYAKKGKYPLYADREFLALGAANALAGFFQGYPVAGGLSRTAVNAQAGARTGLSAVVTSVAVLAALLFLTPLLSNIPQAALAAIIVTAVFSLVELRQVRERFRVQKSEGILLVFSFLATLGFGIMTGLIAGTLASLVWFLWRTTRPHLAVLGRVPGTQLFRNVKRYRGLVTYEGVLILRLDAQLYFANAEYFRDQLAKLEAAAPLPLQLILLDASAINHIDSSAAELLEELDSEYEARQIRFLLAGVKGPVRDVLERTGLMEKRRNEYGYVSVHEALEAYWGSGQSPHRPSRTLGTAAGL